MPQIQLRGMEVQCHIFLAWYYVEMIGYLHTPYSLPWRKSLGDLID